MKSNTWFFIFWNGLKFSFKDTFTLSKKKVNLIFKIKLNLVKNTVVHHYTSGV